MCTNIHENVSKIITMVRVKTSSVFSSCQAGPVFFCWTILPRFEIEFDSQTIRVLYVNFEMYCSDKDFSTLHNQIQHQQVPLEFVNNTLSQGRANIDLANGFFRVVYSE